VLLYGEATHRYVRRFEKLQKAVLATCSLGLFFDPEDGGDMFLRNFDWLSTATRRYIPEDQTLHSEIDWYICVCNKRASRPTRNIKSQHISKVTSWSIPR
jgi:hypothetical protein